MKNSNSSTNKRRWRSSKNFNVTSFSCLGDDKPKKKRNHNPILISTWSPAPTSCSFLSTWTPWAMLGDCCSMAIKRFKVWWSKPIFYCKICCFVCVIIFFSSLVKARTNWKSHLRFSSRFWLTNKESEHTFGGVIITNVFNSLTYHFLVVDNCLWGDFTAQEDHAGFSDSFWNF